MRTRAQSIERENVAFHSFVISFNFRLPSLGRRVSHVILAFCIITDTMYLCRLWIHDKKRIFFSAIFVLFGRRRHLFVSVRFGSCALVAGVTSYRRHDRRRHHQNTLLNFVDSLQRLDAHKIRNDFRLRDFFPSSPLGFLRYDAFLCATWNVA